MSVSVHLDHLFTPPRTCPSGVSVLLVSVSCLSCSSFHPAPSLTVWSFCLACVSLGPSCSSLHPVPVRLEFPSSLCLSLSLHPAPSLSIWSFRLPCVSVRLALFSTLPRTCPSRVSVPVWTLVFKFSLLYSHCVSVHFSLSVWTRVFKFSLLYSHLLCICTFLTFCLDSVFKFSLLYSHLLRICIFLSLSVWTLVFKFSLLYSVSLTVYLYISLSHPRTLFFFSFSF